MKQIISAKVFGKAIIFSAKAHEGQVRKGDGRPFIMHPMSVMARVRQIKPNTSNPFLLGSAAMLHDTKEDCGVKLKTIAKKFGHHVAALVKELTLNKKLYKKYGKAEYLAMSMNKMSSYALVIKLCDRLDNVCDMDSMSESFVKRYVKETYYILERIKDRKLTPTHKKLIKLIKKKLEKYE